jgi:hypothetical protein
MQVEKGNEYSGHGWPELGVFGVNPRLKNPHGRQETLEGE